MKHCKNDLVYEGLRNIFWFISGKYRQINLYSGNKCINNINSMFKTDVQKMSIKTI